MHCVVQRNETKNPSSCGSALFPLLKVSLWLKSNLPLMGPTFFAGWTLGCSSPSSPASSASLAYTIQCAVSGRHQMTLDKTHNKLVPPERRLPGFWVSVDAVTIKCSLVDKYDTKS